MTVRVPTAGHILQRTARPGDSSASGTVLFTIARDNLVELDAEIPEAAMSQIAIGAYMLILDNHDRVHRVGVRTGRRSGDVVELVAGPKPGARAVMGGAAFVLEGDKLRIDGKRGA